MLDLDFSARAGDAARDRRGTCWPATAPSTVVRQMEDDPVGYPPELWRSWASST